MIEISLTEKGEVPFAALIRKTRKVSVKGYISVATTNTGFEINNNSLCNFSAGYSNTLILSMQMIKPSLVINQISELLRKSTT